MEYGFSAAGCFKGSCIKGGVRLFACKEQQASLFLAWRSDLILGLED
jgi:hypothetical protein